MDSQPISFYAQALKAALPTNAFDPVRSRLAWLALHYAVIVAGLAALYRHRRLVGRAACALVIGHSFAGAAFVGHETLHGAVVRARGPAQLHRLVLLPAVHAVAAPVGRLAQQDPSRAHDDNA